MSTGKNRSSTQELTDYETEMPGFFHSKNIFKNIFRGGKRIWFHFIFLNCFKSQCSQALTQCSSVAMLRLMYSSVLFKNQNIPCSMEKARPQKEEAGIWTRQSLFPETWRIRIGIGHMQKRRCATAWAVSKSMIHINDKRIFLAEKNCFAVLLGQCCMRSALMPGLHLYCMQGELKSARSWCCSKPDCLVQTRTLAKTKAREYRSSLLLQTWSGKERQGHQ